MTTFEFPMRVMPVCSMCHQAINLWRFMFTCLCSQAFNKSHTLALRAPQDFYFADKGCLITCRPPPLTFIAVIQSDDKIILGTGWLIVWTARMCHYTVVPHHTLPYIISSCLQTLTPHFSWGLEGASNLLHRCHLFAITLLAPTSNPQTCISMPKLTINQHKHS